MKEEHEVNGFTIAIERCESHASPFIDNDMLGTLQVQPNCPYNVTRATPIPDRAGLNEVLNDPKVVALEVFAYTKGGILLNTTGFNCRWDSGTFGVISVTHEKAKQQMGWKRMSKQRIEKVRSILAAEIQELDDHLNNNVWRWNMLDEHGDSLDSCGGFTGDEGKVEALADATNCANRWVHDN